MNIKLDENFGERGATLLRELGHDVMTVRDQDLCGTQDDTLIEVCRAEHRVLITLDMDFANPIHYPPERYAGIVVIRSKSRTSLEQLHLELMHFAKAVKKHPSLQGCLWILQNGFVRAYAPESDV